MDTIKRKEFLRCLKHDFWALRAAPICVYKPYEISKLLVDTPYAVYRRKAKGK